MQEEEGKHLYHYKNKLEKAKNLYLSRVKEILEDGKENKKND